MNKKNQQKKSAWYKRIVEMAKNPFCHKTLPKPPEPKPPEKMEWFKKRSQDVDEQAFLNEYMCDFSKTINGMHQSVFGNLHLSSQQAASAVAEMANTVMNTGVSIQELAETMRQFPQPTIRNENDIQVVEVDGQRYAIIDRRSLSLNNPSFRYEEKVTTVGRVIPPAAQPPRAIQAQPQQVTPPEPALPPAPPTPPRELTPLEQMQIDAIKKGRALREF